MMSRARLPNGTPPGSRLPVGPGRKPGSTASVIRSDLTCQIWPSGRRLCGSAALPPSRVEEADAAFLVSHILGCGFDNGAFQASLEGSLSALDLNDVVHHTHGRHYANDIHSCRRGLLKE